MTQGTSDRRPMRIAVTADPELPVPPRGYGGIERIIHFLVEGLVARGHEVTLIAHRDSEVPCRLVPYPCDGGQSPLERVRIATTVARTVYGGSFDVVHSFGRLASIAPLALHPSYKLMSYQRPVTPRSIRLARRLFRGSLEFTACSRQMIGDVETLATWHVVYNGVRMATFTAIADVPDDAPLVFLGRVEEIKGPHVAIEVARRSNRRLIIAGNVEREHQDFFDQRVRPYVDGTRVQFVGTVDDTQKNELLGRCAALLMPIVWEEPFGIVMAEALACGTPVLGFRRGSVPEVVDEGVTGFISDDADGMVASVARLGAIDRRRCREAAEARFSDASIVHNYEAVYRQLGRRAPLAATAQAG